MSETTETDATGGSIRHSVAGDGTLMISLVGELDVSNTEQVRTDLEHLVRAQPASSAIVFDLAELIFVDSSGLAALLHVARERGHVTVRNASPIVRRIIEVTGLTEILTIES